MGAAPKRKTKIPNFRSDDEERAFWEYLRDVVSNPARVQL